MAGIGISDEFKQTIKDHENWDPVVTMMTPDGGKISFHVPNEVALRRAQSIFVKEPCTIQWLDNFRRDGVFLDVGANVGIYTIYASVIRGVRTFAFEPESQNFALLNKNIVTNKLSGRVLATCAALSDQIELDRLYLSEFRTGSSCHSFGEEVGFDLKKRHSPYMQGCVSLTIDSLVDNGDIEIPNYIKVDVDGFEHKVLLGAENTLARPEVEEILIEINPGIAEHRSLVSWLADRGFVYDGVQAALAARVEGAFKGVGEIIFKRRLARKVKLEYVQGPKELGSDKMSLDESSRHTTAMKFALSRIRESSMQLDPFPYKVVDDVFPRDYFDEILAQFPHLAAMGPLGETGRVSEGAYADRRCILLNSDGLSRLANSQQSFWKGLAGWLFHSSFINQVCDIFLPYVENRLAFYRTEEGCVRVRGDGLIVSDRTNYAIGPHTDAPHRLISFLFYLPETDVLRSYGTSIYKPNDPCFKCSRGVHHPYDMFKRISTIEFIPNRLFVFVKNEKSFHGVEQIKQLGVERRLLIYNVRLLDVKGPAAPA